MARSVSTLLSISALLLRAYSAPVDVISGQFPLGLSFGVPGNQSFDYVIVGGGTAGLVLASRLSENPSFSVAVVEAGGFYEVQNGDGSEIPADDYIGTDKNNQSYNPLVDWGFVTTPQQALNGAELHYARGRCLGGSSVRNYMAYTRGTKQSYDLWAEAVGDSSYSFENWLPYFQKSLNFSPPQLAKRAANATPQYDANSIGRDEGLLSVTYPNYAQPVSSWVSKGLQAIGISPTDGFTSGELMGSSYILNTIQADSMLRETSETGFLRPALKRSNLVVYTETLAKRILFDGKTATGVLVNTKGREYVLSATKEVILSAGAFQSPQLLMVSGVGPSSTLKTFSIPVVVDRAGVGQNMWDHVFFGPSYRANVITDSSLANAQVAAQAATAFETMQEGALTNPVGDYFAFEKLPKSSLVSYNITSALSAFPSDWPEVEYLSVAAFLGNYYDLATGPNNGHNYAALVAALVAPLSRGTVSISSADMADPPIIDPQWLSNPVDQAVAVAAYKRIQQALSSSAMEAVVIESPYWPSSNKTQTDPQILETIKGLTMTVWHASCTNKMGMVNDTMAVVDSKARVIGVQNLRVVDASSFALLPPGHPLATVYALAEKIADDIKNDAGSSGYS